MAKKAQIIYLDADNINTDGIYPGSMTYQDVTKEDMARACMKNYDPEFNNIAKPGDIIVTGHNFGCGSSREQAATAIIAKGISLVIVGSLANIFSRNSINNALISLEVPKVLERLRKAFPSDLRNRTAGVIEPDLNYPPPATTKETGMVLTRRTGWTLTWDAGKSRIEVTEGSGGPSWKVRVGELPTNVQEIIACGGLEKWVKSQLVNS